jgi:hypothetical protein
LGRSSRQPPAISFLADGCLKEEFMTVREGRWDCQYCAATGILGRFKSCNSCGRSRPEGTKFYLPASEGAVTDAALLKQAQLGPDWVCEFCSSSNAADRATCNACAAPKGSSPGQRIREYKTEETPRSGDMDMSVPPPPRPGSQPAAAKTGRPKWLLGSCAALLVFLFLCICGSLVLSRVNRQVEATVSGLQWERTVAVEAYQTVREEDWNVPAGGRTLSQRQDIHHYDQVLVGYETRQREVSEQVQVGQDTYVCGQRDMGNGFFEDIECTNPVYQTQYRTESYQEPIYRQDPVYQTKYTYEIDKWVVVHTERANGNNSSAYWPELRLADSEREGRRTETYTVHLTDKNGKSYSLPLPFEEWRGLEVGATYQIKVNISGEIIEIIR